MNSNSLKVMFMNALKEIARDKNGDVIRVECPNGEYKLLTRGELVIDKCISRAERGDMYATKLIVDLVEPKELRIAVQSAITVEHKLSPILQTIVDKLVLGIDTSYGLNQNEGTPPTGYPDSSITPLKLEESPKIDISEGGAKT